MIHHAESNNYTWQQCNTEHKLPPREWNCGGYNEYIGLNGVVYIMRGDHIGAQCQDYNSKSYGICCEGNYDKPRQMPEAQFKALVARCRANLRRFPANCRIIPHSALVATGCPGDYFPMARLYKEVGDITMTAADAIKVLVRKEVISSPEYWLKAIDVVKNLDILLINMANKLV